MTTADPSPDDPGSPASRVILYILLTLLFPLVLLIRAVAFLVAAAKAAWAGRQVAPAHQRLGERMEGVPVGDEFVRDRIAVARKAKNVVELREALIALGRSGAAAGVPPIGAEQEYKYVHEALDRRTTSEANRKAAIADILPRDGIGWLRLAIGCAATGGFIYGLVAAFQ